MDILKYIPNLFLLIILLGCSKYKNEVVEKQVPLDTFSHVVIEDPFSITLTNSTSSSIVIKSSRRFVDNVVSTISGDTLFLSCNSKQRWLYPNTSEIDITINYTTLKKLVANETCFIKTSNPIVTDKFNLILKSKANHADLMLDCADFSYWNNSPCGGELKLSGQTNHMALWNYALMKVDASELTCQSALIENHAKADITANVANELNYGISNVGNIILSIPTTNITQDFLTGTGELIIGQ